MPKLSKNRSVLVQEKEADLAFYFGERDSNQIEVAKKNGGRNIKSARKYLKNSSVEERATIDSASSDFFNVKCEAAKTHTPKTKRSDSIQKVPKEEKHNSSSSKKRSGQKRQDDFAIDYVELAKRYKENARQMRSVLKHSVTEGDTRVSKQVLKDNVNRKEEEKLVRHNTAERTLKLPKLHVAESSDYDLDSSDSPSPSPVYAVRDRFKNQPAANRVERDEAWKPEVPKRMDSLTVDRRPSTKRDRNESVRRNASFNMDSDLQVAYDESLKFSTVSGSTRSCNTARTPLLNSRRAARQISAEDMVQVANGGARNKNGSLRHFITVGDDGYATTGSLRLHRAARSDFRMYESARRAETANNPVYYVRKTTEGDTQPRSSLSLRIDSSDDAKTLTPSATTERRTGKPTSSSSESKKSKRHRRIDYVPIDDEMTPKSMSGEKVPKRSARKAESGKVKYPTCDSLSSASQNSLSSCQCLSIEPHPKAMELSEVNLSTFTGGSADFSAKDSVPESFDF